MSRRRRSQKHGDAASEQFSLKPPRCAARARRRLSRPRRLSDRAWRDERSVVSGVRVEGKGAPRHRHRHGGDRVGERELELTEGRRVGRSLLRRTAKKTSAVVVGTVNWTSPTVRETPENDGTW